jgi:hypothetical protein
VIAKINHPNISQLTEILTQDSGYGASHKEGIVIKRVGWRNKWGNCVWGKMIHPGFDQKQSKPQADRDVPLEVQFASLCTQHYVVKEMMKIRDEVGDEAFTLRCMPRIIETVWHQLFTEELWTFVKKAKRVNGGVVVDFTQMKKLVSNEARGVALAWFNGTLGVEV